jgi:opacity protein-like surface antigen
MNTKFYIASLRAGPEFVGTGRVRPYIFGTAGVSYFATETSVGICCGTTNYHDAVTSFAGGGGLRLDLSHSRRRPVSLDLGATFVRNGEVNYLREGDIVNNPDGSYTFNPVRSETNLFLMHAGLTFAL